MMKNDYREKYNELLQTCIDLQEKNRKLQNENFRLRQNLDDISSLLEFVTLSALAVDVSDFIQNS